MRKIMFLLAGLCLIYTGPVVSAEDVTTAVVKAGVKGAFNELEKQMIKNISAIMSTYAMSTTMDRILINTMVRENLKIKGKIKDYLPALRKIYNGENPCLQV